MDEVIRRQIEGWLGLDRLTQGGLCPFNRTKKGEGVCVTIFPGLPIIQTELITGYGLDAKECLHRCPCSQHRVLHVQHKVEIYMQRTCQGGEKKEE